MRLGQSTATRYPLSPQDKHEKVEIVCQQALKRHETMLGLEHKDTLYFPGGLAYCKERQGKRYEAKALAGELARREEAAAKE